VHIKTARQPRAERKREFRYVKGESEAQTTSKAVVGRPEGEITGVAKTKIISHGRKMGVMDDCAGWLYPETPNH